MQRYNVNGLRTLSTDALFTTRSRTTRSFPTSATMVICWSAIPCGAARGTRCGRARNLPAKVLLLLFTTFTSQCLIHEISDASWLICPGMLPHVRSAMCLSWFSICRTFRVEDSKISYMPKNWYRQVLSGVLILFILSDCHFNLPWIYNKGQFTILSLHLYKIL